MRISTQHLQKREKRFCRNRYIRMANYKTFEQGKNGNEFFARPFFRQNPLDIRGSGCRGTIKYPHSQKLNSNWAERKVCVWKEASEEKEVRDDDEKGPVSESSIWAQKDGIWATEACPHIEPCCSQSICHACLAFSPVTTSRFEIRIRIHRARNLDGKSRSAYESILPRSRSPYWNRIRDQSLVSIN